MYVLLKDITTHGGELFPKGTKVFIGYSNDGETMDVYTVEGNKLIVVDIHSIAPLVPENLSSERLRNLVDDSRIELKTAFANYYPYDEVVFVEDLEELIKELKEEGK
ncbi:hypothetical protein EH802P2_00093 [Enterococcus phage EH802P2]|nr:hypothetical protein EH802P1_00006 [Enterococcus phage EH802P1]WAX16198.1 hypothetical protein EH802P2_00093 [Enterococcus phage EH802P2]